MIFSIKQHVTHIYIPSYSHILVIMPLFLFGSPAKFHGWIQLRKLQQQPEAPHRLFKSELMVCDFISNGRESAELCVLFHPSSPDRQLEINWERNVSLKSSLTGKVILLLLTDQIQTDNVLRGASCFNILTLD